MLVFRMKYIMLVPVLLVTVLCFGDSTGTSIGNRRRYLVGNYDDDPNLPSVFSLAKTDTVARTLAQAIGDGFIDLGEPEWFFVEAGETPAVAAFVDPPDPNEYIPGNQEDVCRYAARQLRLTAAEKGETRAEVNLQIQRLWRACTPVLLDNLGHSDPTINEAVIRNLIMMRSSRIVEAIIEKVRTTEEESVRLSGLFVLGMMKERRQSRIPRRQLMSEEESDRLVRERIMPFLREMEETADGDTLTVIRNAHKYLDRPFELRTKRE